VWCASTVDVTFDVRQAYATKRGNSAARLQAGWRGLIDRRRAKLIAWRRWNCTRIQAWWRGTCVRQHVEAIFAAQRELGRQHRAAFAIQRYWWRAKPGRLLARLKWLNARKLELLHLRKVRRGCESASPTLHSPHVLQMRLWVPAATRIQCALRLALTRRLLKRHHFAVVVQSQWRRILAIRRVTSLRQQIRSNVRCHLLCVLKLVVQ